MIVLEDALHWGTLPKIYSLADSEEKHAYLRAYALTYLKEKIVAEQIIRRLDPIREFLEVAAQSNGTIINYANIARDVGADSKTITSYFSILEDTLVGFHLPAYRRSTLIEIKSSDRIDERDTRGVAWFTGDSAARWPCASAGIRRECSSMACCACTGAMLCRSWD